MNDLEKKKMPKGGAKGGTRFPRVDLKKAVEYAKKLVSKTHTGGQPRNIILPGVFNNSGGEGNVRISALKQYGLLEEVEGLIKATDFAKEIAASPENEVYPLLQKACLSPKVFHDVYETYKEDSVNLSKIKQFAVKADVHLDSADDFTLIFSQSLVYSGLAQLNGEEIKVYGKEIKPILEESEEIEQEIERENTETNLLEKDDENKGPVNKHQTIVKRNATATVQVSINLDSTMDADKLDKMLKLLKTYGAI